MRSWNKREWLYYTLLLPEFIHDVMHRLLRLPLLGKWFWYMACVCPKHWCNTYQFDEWQTRRYCVKCGYWWDLG